MTLADINSQALRDLCIAYRVRKMYVFGSIVTGEMTPTSDLDVVVDFDREGPDGAFDQFMGFKENLEELYGRPVDLLTQRSFRNPLFEAEVERTKHLVYAA